MSALDRAAIAAVDRRSMVDDVLAQSGQVDDALWRVESAGVPRAEAPGGLLVCGMGGSAIGGDLARACVGGRARRPLLTVRGYDAEPWLSEDTLVLCASYSGNTEETLSSWEAARAAGAPRVAVTTGGALAEAARADGAPVVGVPSGMQPRAAVVYMTVAALECAAACGAAPSLHAELEAAAGLLAELAAEWGPDAESDSDAKKLAGALEGAVPIVYGAGPTAAVARRWKTQLNENAKLPAFFSELPEADHNEIAGLAATSEHAPLEIVTLLRGSSGDERLECRLMLTARLGAEAGLGARAVTARGETLTEQTMSLVLLGDLVSVYLAALRGVDPTPVEAIECFKRMVAGRDAGRL